MPGFEVIGREEEAEVNEVFAKSGILFRHGFDNLRDGVFKVRDFEKAFAARMGVDDALAVTSGSAALRVGLAALNIGPGDEVITQAFTFVATVEAIIEAGAQPVIAEVDESLNIDPDDLERRITPATRAIIVVHMLGVPTDMARVMQIAREHDLKVIEDTAWGCGGKLDDRPLGTIADIGTFSFDFAKTITTGEGGMVIGRSQRLLERAKAYHDHGHENNPELPRWEDSRSGSGFNYRMMELQGAVGLAQLRKLDAIVTAQRRNKERIAALLRECDLDFRPCPRGTYETADALVFFVKNNVTARRCRDELLDVGIGTKILPEAVTWHFAGTWDHMPQLSRYYGNDLANAFPRSAEHLNRSVAIPITVHMDDDTPAKIRQAVERALAGV